MNVLSNTGLYSKAHLHSYVRLISPQGGREGVTGVPTAVGRGLADGGGDVSPGNGAPPDTCPICKAKQERFEQFI